MFVVISGSLLHDLLHVLDIADTPQHWCINSQLSFFSKLSYTLAFVPKMIYNDCVEWDIKATVPRMPTRVKMRGLRTK